MTIEVRNGLLEIKSSTYPEDIKVIRRISDGEVFGSIVYVNALNNSSDNFEEIDKPIEEAEEML